MSPRRPEITEDEVLRHNVWNLSYLLEKIGGLLAGRIEVNKPLEPGIYEVEVDGVVDLSNELTPMTLVTFKIGGKVEPEQEDQTDRAEHGEGTVSDERLD